MSFLLRELYWEVCRHSWRYFTGLVAVAGVMAALAATDSGVAGVLAILMATIAMAVLAITAEPLREQFSWGQRASELPVTWCGEVKRTPDLKHDCALHLTYHGFGKRWLAASLVDVLNSKAKGALGFKFQWDGESDSMRFTHRGRGTIKFGRLTGDGRANWHFIIEYKNEAVGPVPQPESCRYSWKEDPTLGITNYPTMLRTPLVFVIEISDQETGRSKELSVGVLVRTKSVRRPIPNDSLFFPGGASTVSEELVVVLEDRSTS